MAKKKKNNNNNNNYKEKVKQIKAIGKAMGKEVGITNFKAGYTNIEDVQEDFNDYFAQSAEYANSILPDLRSLAGCKDPMGVGTFRDCTDDQEEDVNEFVDLFWDSINESIEDTMIEAKKAKSPRFKAISNIKKLARSLGFRKSKNPKGNPKPTPKLKASSEITMREFRSMQKMRSEGKSLTEIKKKHPKISMTNIRRNLGMKPAGTRKKTSKRKAKKKSPAKIKKGVTYMKTTQQELKKKAKKKKMQLGDKSAKALKKAIIDLDLDEDKAIEFVSSVAKNSKRVRIKPEDVNLLRKIN